jgi:hypothetical protein
MLVPNAHKEFGIQLMSDLHIGAPQVNYKLIQRELENASKSGDRICINGDVFDAIIAGDHKRFTPDSIHPRLFGRKDTLNAAIEWGVELLGPYGQWIDMVGIGNHESAVEKYHAMDPVRILIYELSKLLPKEHKKHVIHYGGYTGFVDYRIPESGKQASRWVLYYHHGSGGASPVTKGMIDFNRKDTFVDADCIWMGHKHNRWNASSEKISCPLASSKGPIVKVVRHVMTGSYMKTYVAQTQQSLKKHGRRTSYAADAGLSPQGQGGARVILKRCWASDGAYVKASVVQ